MELLLIYTHVIELFKGSNDTFNEKTFGRNKVVIKYNGKIVLVEHRVLNQLKSRHLPHLL